MRKVYETKHRSAVELNGDRVTIYFDWLEEPDACIDCKPNPDPAEIESGVLSWSCDVCDGGSAELKRIDCAANNTKFFTH